MASADMHDRQRGDRNCCEPGRQNIPVSRSDCGQSANARALAANQRSCDVEYGSGLHIRSAVSSRRGRFRLRIPTKPPPCCEIIPPPGSENISPPGAKHRRAASLRSQRGVHSRSMSRPSHSAWLSWSASPLAASSLNALAMPVRPRVLNYHCRQRACELPAARTHAATLSSTARGCGEHTSQ